MTETEQEKPKKRAPVPKPPDNPLPRRIVLAIIIRGVAAILWPFAQRQGALPVETFAAPGGAHEVVLFEKPTLFGDGAPGFFLLQETGGQQRVLLDVEVPDVRTVEAVDWQGQGFAIEGIGRWDIPDPDAPEDTPEGDQGGN